MSFALRQLRTIVAPFSRFAKVRAETSRRTSAFLTVADWTTRPAMASFKSRAIVSVSGSSGMSLQLSPANVASELLAIETDFLCVLARALRRFLNGIADSRNGENPSARCEELVRCVVPDRRSVKDM